MNRHLLHTVAPLALGVLLLAPPLVHAAEAPLSPTRGTVEVPMDHRQKKGGPTRTLAYERYGEPSQNKKPLIFLHGGPGAAVPNMDVFVNRIPVGQLLAKDYDIVYFDQRGAGASLLPEEKEPAYVQRHAQRYTTEQYVEDIETLRQKLFGKERKVTILGSSWGGFLGMEYALRHPEAVEAVMLGSFESTGRSTGDICNGFEKTMWNVEQESPELARALPRFRQAVAEGRLVWHAGKPEQRNVRLHNLIDIAIPFAMKAKHAELAAAIEQMVDGTEEGRALLDSLELTEELEVTLGESLPGNATFCQELVSTRYAQRLVEEAPAALYCDNRAYARGLLRSCTGYRPRQTFFDNGSKLAALKVPALLFAGDADPLIPWEASARTAGLIPGASFVLVRGGGHSPFREGGTCLAEAVDGFLRGARGVNQSCDKPATSVAESRKP